MRMDFRKAIAGQLDMGPELESLPEGFFIDITLEAPCTDSVDTKSVVLVDQHGDYIKDPLTLEEENESKLSVNQFTPAWKNMLLLYSNEAAVSNAIPAPEKNDELIMELKAKNANKSDAVDENLSVLPRKVRDKDHSETIGLKICIRFEGFSESR